MTIRRSLEEIRIGPLASSRGNSSWSRSKFLALKHVWLRRRRCIRLSWRNKKRGKENSKEYLIHLCLIPCLLCSLPLCSLLTQDGFYRISHQCQFWLTGHGWLKPWGGKNAAATAGFSGREGHSWLVMAARSWPAGVTTIIYDTVEICPLGARNLEGRQD